MTSLVELGESKLGAPWPTITSCPELCSKRDHGKLEPALDQSQMARMSGSWGRSELIKAVCLAPKSPQGSVDFGQIPRLTVGQERVGSGSSFLTSPPVTAHSGLPLFQSLTPEIPVCYLLWAKL